MITQTRIIGGVELPRWPKFSEKFRKDRVDSATLYRDLCLARLTLFKSNRLNGRFQELALTQTHKKVTLYHFLYLLIPSCFLSSAVVIAEHTHNWLIGGVVCALSIGVGVVIAHLLPRLLWSLLGLYERKGWFLMDEAKAVNLWRESAERGNDYGQAALGYMYENGKGVEKDPVEAYKWYRKAAEQNGDLGKYLLAALYENGVGVEKNLVEAYKWYSLTFTRNIPDELKKHADRMTTEQIAEAMRRAEAFVPAKETCPEELKIKPRPLYPRKLIIIVAFAYGYLTIMLVHGLNQLERHQVSTIMFKPIFSIYRRYGYWPAALITPGFGVVFLSLLMWQNRRKTNKQS